MRKLTQEELDMLSNIETTVYNKADRSGFYKKWFEENRRTHRGTNRYRLVSKA